MYCIGKSHKPYEYGNKVFFAATAKFNIIVGVVGHPFSLHDNKTLSEVLAHCHNNRGKVFKTGVYDRGYRGPKMVNGTHIILPAPPLKRDNRYQRDQKRKRCQRRTAIEPIICHFKSDFRLARNLLKGVAEGCINLVDYRSLEFQPLDEAIFCADFDHQDGQTSPASADGDPENAIC